MVTNPLTRSGGFSEEEVEGRDRVQGFDVSSYFGNEGDSARCTGGKIKVAAAWQRYHTKRLRRLSATRLQTIYDWHLANRQTSGEKYQSGWTAHLP